MQEQPQQFKKSSEQGGSKSGDNDRGGDIEIFSKFKHKK